MCKLSIRKGIAQGGVLSQHVESVQAISFYYFIIYLFIIIVIDSED